MLLSAFPFQKAHGTDRRYFTDAGGKEYLQREKLKQEVEFQKTTNVQTATEKEESALQSAILYIPFRTIKNLLNHPGGS